MNGGNVRRKGMWLSVSVSADPALVVIAAAPMTTHSTGVMSSGATSRSACDKRTAQYRSRKARADAPQDVNDDKDCGTEALRSGRRPTRQNYQRLGAHDLPATTSAASDVGAERGVEKREHREAEICE